MNWTREEFTKVVKAAQEEAVRALNLVNPTGCQQQCEDINEYNANATSVATEKAKQLLLEQWKQTPNGKKALEDDRLEEERSALILRRKHEARIRALNESRMNFAKENGFSDWESFLKYKHELDDLHRYKPWWSWMTCLPKRIRVPYYL